MRRRKLLKIITKIKADRLKFHRTMKFPDNFVWGTSTSAHQIEGNNKNNDWWQWEKRSRKRFNSGGACQSYKLYREDIALLKQMNQKAYRFSIEWSRIEPDPGRWNMKAVAHYRKIISELNKKNIKPFVTLHHFTNPAWLVKMKGWENRRSVYYFNRYVDFVVDQLGDLVDYWLTINEPLVYTTQSYLAGEWPPQLKSYRKTYRVYRNLLLTHKKAYQKIHAIYKKNRWHVPKVGIANSTVSIYSYNVHSFKSWLFVKISDWIWNHSFFTFSKKFHDFIGMNYYFHYRLKDIHFKTLRFFIEARKEHREMSQVGWEVYPQGIFDVLLEFKKYNKPIYVTENGIATINEKKRTRYLVAYLKEVYHAIQAGVKIKGFFYWSLLDNFEWEKGFEPKFGLVAVNLRNFKRSIKPAGKIYSQIAKSNSLPQKLMHYLGH